MRTLLVFSGASKSGKTTLARRLARERAIPYSSFSAVVRRLASERNPNLEQSISLLQNLGQEMVDKDPCGFCREVCAEAIRKESSCHILDGLRHRRLIPILSALHPGYEIRVVYTEASRQARLARFQQRLSEAELDAIDSHAVEKDLGELKDAADFALSTDCNEEDSYRKLISWLAREGTCGTSMSHDERPNISRGFKRLWFVFSLIWLLMVLITSLTPNGALDIAAFEHQKQGANLFAPQHALPLSCGTTKGVRSLDYFEFQGRCWMLLDRYRVLYPENATQSDRDLANRIYAEISRDSPIPSAWHRFLRIVVVSTLGPLLTLAVGLAVLFIGRGFKSTHNLNMDSH